MGTVSKLLLRSLIVALSVALLVPTSLARPAGATAGYGYDHARDCSNQFGLYSWCIEEDGRAGFTDAEQWSPYGFGYRNCTDWVATRVRHFGIAFSNGMGGGRFGNARNWDDNARTLGWTVSTTPRVRSIGVNESNHVAFVETVNADGTVNISEYNRGGTGQYGTRNGVRFDSYIYVPGLTQAPPPPPSDLSRYRITIVKWSGSSTTAWFVTPDLKRLWIPDGGTYNQLRARGFAGPYVLDAGTLDRMPDQRDQWVASGSSWGKNRTLRRGMSVRSSDGRYLFAMQDDGNLVLYAPSGRALWSTDRLTSAWRSQEFVIFQGDGNLVTYGGGRAIWASGTAGRGGDHFEVQGDGNLVVYAGSRPLWASNTAGRT
ncbi:CHAP domain-containing protein [Nocardioides immobilis]|uniref:CHAP domain-containing protein n=1 Tax=Nocardioides immobilis TaxID=2049295 RepID=A0A417XYH8_9ACTN|nr:CHAP domain-containing protein [Nocardioides immobilis]RHW25430.1 CHAP domain-containing protein [Nocardioides immobilis]